MKIYQLKNQSPCQMMGYVIVTNNGKVIVFDGGTADTTELFREIIALQGNHIDYWFITHPHHDHYSVFKKISEEPGEITADAVYYSPMDPELAASDPNRAGEINGFNDAINNTPFTLKTLCLGEIFKIGDLEIEVLGIANPDIKEDVYNNNSCAFMVTEKYDNDNEFKLLILGDLAIKGGDKLAAMHGKRLKADMVQMAHHGQNACEKRVYELIAPKYTLWPTPDWLWTNTCDPEKPGEGPWKTLIVRGWLEELGATPITSLEKTAIITVDKGDVSVTYYHK